MQRCGAMAWCLSDTSWEFYQISWTYQAGFGIKATLGLPYIVLKGNSPKIKVLLSGTLSKLWTSLLFHHDTSIIAGVVNLVQAMTIATVYHIERSELLFMTRWAGFICNSRDLCVLCTLSGFVVLPWYKTFYTFIIRHPGWLTGCLRGNVWNAGAAFVMPVLMPNQQCQNTEGTKNTCNFYGHFMGVNEPVAPLSLFLVFWERNFRIIWFLQARRPPCYPTNTVKPLKGSRGLTYNREIPVFIHPAWGWGTSFPSFFLPCPFTSLFFAFFVFFFLFIRSTQKSRPNIIKWVSNVRPSTQVSLISLKFGM